jgi:hypothetical protein
MPMNASASATEISDKEIRTQLCEEIKTYCPTKTFLVTGDNN